MAEENLEGMDDLDALLDDDAGGGGGEGDFAGELDDFLSDEGGAEEGAPGEDGEGGDSELDSFFEDLSTIDDLEVVQEDEPAAAEEVPAAEPAAAAVAATAAVAAAAPAVAAAPVAPREKGPPGRFRRLLKRIVILAILVGAGYFAYIFVLPYFQQNLPEKWKDIKEMAPFGGEEQTERKAEPAEKPPPEPPPPAAVAPPQEPSLPPPPPGEGYGVQVATCFFLSCVEGYQGLLRRTNRATSIKETTTTSKSLEIVTSTEFINRQAADEMAARINREHKLEGQAYTLKEGGAFRISMGTFPELGRANKVKDALNQRLGGEVTFTSKLKTVPYTLRRVVTGRFATRARAVRELRALKKLDRRFRGSFVVRN